MGRSETAALISGALCVSTVLYTLGVVSKVTSFGSATTNDVQERRESMKLRVELAARLFDVSIVLLGAVWGLIVTDKITIGPGEWSGWILIGSDNILLGGSAFFHIQYRRLLGDLLWQTGQALPDIYNRNVNYAFQLQWTLLLAGLICTMLTIIATTGRVTIGGV